MTKDETPVPLKVQNDAQKFKENLGNSWTPASLLLRPKRKRYRRREDISSRTSQARDKRQQPEGERCFFPFASLPRPGQGSKGTYSGGGRCLRAPTPNDASGPGGALCQAMGAPSPASYSACFLSGFLLAAALSSLGTDACPSIAWIPFQKSCYALLQGSSEVYSMDDARELCQDNGTVWTGIIVIISTIIVAISAAFLWFHYQRRISSRPRCDNSITQIPCDNRTFFIEDEYSV
ncbi:lymphocyte antigen 75-like [Crotalus adamanteus]|uniref:Lymphocyte antigen 75-like n=1 Tax=Crotalus adamanteus TaxID=8729 RepID=A0AAW1C8K9_CROAD